MLDIRPISVTAPDHAKALRQLFAPPSMDSAPHERDMIEQLLTQARRRSLVIDWVMGIYRQEELIASCAAVESPGRSALVFLAPEVSPEANSQEAMVEILRRLLAAAPRRSLKLLEALIEPSDRLRADSLHAAGFHRITQLQYLRRMTGRACPVECQITDPTWVSYSPESDGLFREALERSYVQTLDCQELTGIRDTSEVMADHRAAGEFNPSLWWVAMRKGEPIGVLLLSLTSGGHSLEIVYLGVAQVARGTGLADSLLFRALSVAREVGAKELALAVDRRNTPARRLYGRWDFVQTGTRDAWIATPCAE